MNVVPTADTILAAAVQARLDGKAKPPGSLGRIEALALQLALIRGSAEVCADKALLLLCAGDHGLTEAGVSAYPAEVTRAMVATLLAGKASANAFARAVGAEVLVVDAGVAADLPAYPGLLDAKVGRGTANAAVAPAMTLREVESALARGAAIARDRLAEGGFEVLLLGEIGIGNSASAALLMHRLAPAPLADCIGAGAGHDAKGMRRKAAALEAAARRTPATAPREVLAEFGGFEIAMMAGAVLGAAAVRRPVIVDGFIGSAAALAAVRLEPASADYLIFSHRSAEKGHARMLEALEARPLLDLSLRLGEGTGALLALPLVRAAARLLTDVASLDEVLGGEL
ncbi:nicotinate-nucleotide--dimethylbenzimidazole phosphoribosyltransferase [Phenylobacterium sp.]|uniref:nicotinate-nucleotide--dimethylbenzimidazole phosphoribosyltransferase n=1 Tax=Phenylobacterium sp. TaxID=1871053 RepID=UPI00301B6ED3